MNKNIVIVGGGTAGWLTALTSKYALPDCNVTVIESDKIGILGAGEGTTPSIINLLSLIEIDIMDLLKKTGGTVKCGIKFTNWSNDGDYYYHPFYASHESVSLNSFLNEIDYEGNPWYDLAIYSGIDKKYFHHDHMALEENKSMNVALHFDAIKVASYLKQKAIDRGINLINGDVEAFSELNGNINKIIFSDGKHIDCDFVFDCTGFSRLIIGKHFKSKWIDYSEFLPVDSAIPFFIDQDETVPIYTEAIAMKYGWMWKIPLQNRYGCGYVFDSSLVSEDDVINEIIEHLGFEPEWPRKDKGSFKFKSGCYEDTWISNCIAIGLSSGFIEPLEATSIAVSVHSLKTLYSENTFDSVFSQNKKEEYNDLIKKINNSVFNFIFYHYITNRTDTDFWKKFENIESYPEEIKSLVLKWKQNTPQKKDLEEIGAIFSLEDFLDIAYGNGILDLNVFKNSEAIQKLFLEKSDLFFLKHKEYMDVVKSYDSHNVVLERIKNYNES